MGKLENLKHPNLAVGSELPTVTREVTLEKMIEFERVVWDRGPNSHNDPQVAQRDGLKTTIASGQNQMAFLHELMEKNFGDSWAFGGKISVRWIHPVYAGDRITPHARVTDIESLNGGRKVSLEVWCENQNGEKTAAGKAYAMWPAERMSWISQEPTAASV